jgi:hypothetical protein
MNSIVIAPPTPVKLSDAGIAQPMDFQARYSERITLLSSQTINSTWTSSSIAVGDYGRMMVFLDVTSLSGSSPSLAIKIDAQDPVTGKWVETETSANITAVGTYALKHEIYEDTARVRIPLGGTGASATISLGVVLKV